MKGWILDKRDRWNEYEHRRFFEEAEEENIQITLYDPKDFDIQITVKGGRSLSFQGQSVSLPDFVFPRTGEGIRDDNKTERSSANLSVHPDSFE